MRSIDLAVMPFAKLANASAAFLSASRSELDMRRLDRLVYPKNHGTNTCIIPLDCIRSMHKAKMSGLGSDQQRVSLKQLAQHEAVSQGAVN